MFSRRTYSDHAVAWWVALLIAALVLLGACSSDHASLPEWVSDGQPPCAAEPGASSNACLVVDADPHAPGLQDKVLGGTIGESFTVDILLDGVTGDATINAFDVGLAYSRDWLLAAEPQPAPEVAEYVASGGWTCRPLTSSAESLGVGRTSIFCRVRAGGQPGPPPGGNRKLASVTFQIVGHGASRLVITGTAGNITRQDGTAAIDDALAGCLPPNTLAGGGCLNATAASAGVSPELAEDLTLRRADCRSDPEGLVCNGQIRNITERQLDHVMAIVYVYTADGTPYGAASAVRSVPLPPGETASFEVTLPLEIDPSELYWRVSFAYASSVRELLWRDDRK